MPSHDPYAAVRYREYRFLLFGGFLANLGSQMQTVAIGWELYERTHSAMALGWVGLVQFLPIILLSIPAGHLADRFDRRRLVIAAQLLMAGASVGLAVLSFTHGNVAWMYACLFAGGVARAISMPAGASLLPALVPRAAFSNAVMWRTTAWHLASTVGPALGGLLIAALTLPAVVYALDAGLILIFIGCLLAMKLRLPTHRGDSATVRSLLAGFRFVWDTKIILAAITLDMFAVLLGGATALLPVYAKDILHVGPSGLGWLRAAPAIGSLLMGLGLAYRRPLQRAGPALLWAVAGFGATMIVFGLSRSYWLSLGMLFASGVLDSISVVIRHTLVQVATPDSLRGRVSAVNGLFISCSNELGEFESGTMAAWFGPVVSVVSGGVGTMLVVVGVAALWPQLRRLGALHEASTPVTEEEEKGLPSA
ncbi:MAG: MFS transporter [Verrucomicrobiota bacterium]